MSAHSRRKGARGELEVVDALHAASFTRAHRNFGSGSAGGGDIAGGPGGVHLEVRRGRRIDLPATIRHAKLEAQPHQTPSLTAETAKAGTRPGRSMTCSCYSR